MSNQKKNGAMKPGVINIHGKHYKTVALRVSEFRELCPAKDGWGLVTEIVEANGDHVTMISKIVHPNGNTVATGFAEEKRTPSGVNKTSALENAETSAIGRALSAFGLAGDEYCSADELVRALANKKESSRPQSPRPAAETLTNSEPAAEGPPTASDSSPYIPDPKNPPQYTLTKDAFGEVAGTKLVELGRDKLHKIRPKLLDFPVKLRELDECIVWREARRKACDEVRACFANLISAVDKEKEDEVRCQGEFWQAVQAIENWEMSDIPEEAVKLSDIINKSLSGELDFGQKTTERMLAIAADLEREATVKGGAK